MLTENHTYTTCEHPLSMRQQSNFSCLLNISIAAIADSKYHNLVVRSLTIKLFNQGYKIPKFPYIIL